MNNKLKAILIAVCCLVGSLWSEAQGMDNHKDIYESATVNHTANMLLSSQNEIDALDLVSTYSQITNLEDSKTSWAFYMISPFKTTVQATTKFLDIAINNPPKALLIGLVLSYQVTAVAANYYCFYVCNDGNFFNDSIAYPNATLCEKNCTFSACYQDKVCVTHGDCIGLNCILR